MTSERLAHVLEQVGRFDLITGGCGFVGRHLTKHILAEQRSLIIVDDLSTGQSPDEWLPDSVNQRMYADSHVVIYGDSLQQVIFFEGDLVGWIHNRWHTIESVTFRFERVFHLASIVGGRAKIENDPMSVALDLAIDSTLMHWAVTHNERIGRILYASSSAAYPIDLQGEEGAVALSEEMIQFDGTLGQPDMTYGWSKLTGEYLAQLAHQKYGVKIACVRPFSGYGGDQDQTYPTPAIARRAARHENPLVVWGTGKQGRDFIHIDDCIEGMCLAIERIEDGSAVNLGTGKLTTFLEVAALFAELAGYEPPIKPLVDKPTGVNSRYADTTQMVQLLDWYPKISLRDGFARVLAQQQQMIAEEGA